MGAVSNSLNFKERWELPTLVLVDMNNDQPSGTEADPGRKNFLAALEKCGTALELCQAAWSAGGICAAYVAIAFFSGDPGLSFLDWRHPAPPLRHDFRACIAVLLCQQRICPDGAPQRGIGAGGVIWGNLVPLHLDGRLWPMPRLYLSCRRFVQPGHGRHFCRSGAPQRGGNSFHLQRGVLHPSMGGQGIAKNQYGGMSCRRAPTRKSCLRLFCCPTVI